MILEGSFFAPGKYGGGAVDIYNGSFKVIGAWEGRDGKVRADWVFPQVKGKNGKNFPREKAVPLSIDLGSDRKHAAGILNTWAKLIMAEPDEETAREPDEGTVGEHYTAKQSDYGEDIPF